MTSPALLDAVGYDDPVAYSAPVPYSLPAGTTTLRLYDAIGPAMRAGDAETGYTLLSWLDGPASLLDDVDQLVAETDLPGWARLFDPQTAPLVALGWLAQLVGERVATDPAGARQQIAGRSRWGRGRPNVILAAVRRTLTGERRAVLIERTDQADSSDRPYRFVVQVDATETPDPAVTAAALAAATPAGLLSSLAVLSTGRYSDAYTDDYPSSLPSGTYSGGYSDTYA